MSGPIQIMNPNAFVSPMPAGSGDVDTSSFLTPDALLAYCQSRLAGLDAQITFTFAEQTKNNADAKALNGLTQWLNTYTQGGVSAETCKPGDLKAAIQTAMYTNGIGETSKTGLALKDMLAKLDKGQYDHLSGDQAKAALTDTVANLQKDLGSGSELSMINLQSLMSQRQTAVQLTTNLVQSLGDQMNKIAANIGH